MTLVQEAYMESKIRTETLAEAVRLSNTEINSMIFGFLITQTPQAFGIRKKIFFRHKNGSDARACCYFLARKYSTISLTIIADRFETDSTNVKRRIQTIEEALKTKRTFEYMIERIGELESSLQTFIKKNNLSNG